MSNKQQQQEQVCQSNLGRGSHHGTVADIRRKVPIGYNGVPQICPKSTPTRGPIPKPHYRPHPWTHPTYDAKRHPDPICRFPQCTGQTDACMDTCTDRRTDRQIVHGKV